MSLLRNCMPEGAHALLQLAVLGVVPDGAAIACALEVFHADSLAGPMREIKKAFEAKFPGVKVNLTAGVSRQLAARILNGDACDVFAPSSTAVIEEDLMNKPIPGSGKIAASWYVVFSGNEMVIITARGNPLGIRAAGDLARAGVRFARVTGDKDLATGRSIEFLRRALAQEETPALAQSIVDGAATARAATVPDVVNAVRLGHADAGIVYYSAAVAARNDVDIVRFPGSVNLSEAIRNAAVVPGTARNAVQAAQFVRFLLSGKAQGILKQTGQPPVAPALRQGPVPEEIR